MLSEREQKVFEYIRKSVKETGLVPSFREIGEALDIKSTSTVYKDIENLSRAGYLKKDPSKKRAITIMEPEEEKKSSYAEPSNIVNIPIVGRVAAGTPILAEQNIEDT
ncbi:MAG: HTH domain-containing protein, partial [Clostridia bacterium]|nr:HTH domain-containing protein [Clostridia bacterium]